MYELLKLKEVLQLPALAAVEQKSRRTTEQISRLLILLQRKERNVRAVLITSDVTRRGDTPR